MRNSLRLAVLALLTLAPLSAQAQETSGSFSEGAILVGYDNRDCDGSLEGSIRYDSASQLIEFCDSTDWQPVIPGVVASSDPTPDAFTFTDLTNQSLGALILSNIVNVTGFDGPLIAEVSGSGTPQISINGGAFGTAGEINPGDSLRVRMTSSVSVSTANVAAVTVGSVTDNWSVTTKAGQTQLFVTNITVAGGSIGGLAGADTICQINAANRGFAGTWKALMSDDTTNAKDRVTIIYPVIRATNGLTIDTTDLFDGSLDTNTIEAGNLITWVGTLATGTTETGNTCDNWSNTAANGGRGVGDSQSSTWLDGSNFSCTEPNAIICVDQ